MVLKHTLTLAAALLLAAPLTATGVNAQQLSGTEIKQKIIGKNLNYRLRGNRIGKVTYASNGTLRWRSAVGQSGKGEWRIEGNRMCTFFAPAGDWRGIPWRCGTIRARGDKFRFGSTTLWR